jgi:outer membrane biosynthesis protein TonB
MDTQPQPTPRTAAWFDRRHRRIWRWSIVVSLLFHLLIVLLFREARLIPPSPFAAAGPRAGDATAAAGGGTQVVALNVMPEIQPQPVVEEAVPEPVPTPEPEPEIVIEDPKPVVTAIPTRIEGTGPVGQGRGAEAGPGTETGTGQGDGGTGEEGLFRVVPPSPRGLILPPSDRPGSVRGKEVDVWVFVSANGRVIADSTRLDPRTTGNGGFDDRLKKQAAEWVFEPARRGGQAIAEWFRYTIVL